MIWVLQTDYNSGKTERLKSEYKALETSESRSDPFDAEHYFVKNTLKYTLSLLPTNT